MVAHALPADAAYGESGPEQGDLGIAGVHVEILLKQGGLGAQVQSCLGNGPNMPVNADQLRAALGDEHVAQLTEQFGQPVEKVLQFLSEHLPQAVDQASPNGMLVSQPAPQ